MFFFFTVSDPRLNSLNSKLSYTTCAQLKLENPGSTAIRTQAARLLEPRQHDYWGSENSLIHTFQGYSCESERNSAG